MSSKKIPQRLPQQLASLGPKLEYTITLDEDRLLRGCSMDRAFPFVIRRKGMPQPVKYARSYEGAALWIAANNGILKIEKRTKK